ncbi:MAG: DUF6263 family protein [Flavihumibacter sp.]|nr:DUF6263 family protein [Flavihumibacter sp.]
MKRFVLAYLFVLTATIGLQAQKIVIAKGQKLETTISTKMTMTMEMMGQSMENLTETVGTTVTEVKEASANGFTLSQLLKKMTMNATMMGQEISFDSDKKEDMDGQMGEAVKGKIGVEEEYKISATGKVLVAPESKSGESNPMNDLSGVSGSIAVGQQLPYLVPVPSKTLKPGDTWVDSSGTAETVKLVNTYTLKEIKGDELIVAVTGVMVKNGATEMNGMEMQIELNGTIKGESVYETATGWLKNGSTNMDVKGSISVMGQSVPIDMKVVATTAAKKL